MHIEDLDILLIEPSITQRKIMLQALEDEQVMEIRTASSAAEARSEIARSQPDLVISNLHYSDGSADQLLAQIRQDYPLDDIPFMLVSSETRRAQLEVFKQSGVVAILPKPFNTNQLHTALIAAQNLLSVEDIDESLIDITKLNVLVVDDSRLARRHVMRVLGNLGIRYLTEADDGSEAIKLLQTKTFDLIVTDYNMPEVNGAELAEHVRKQPALENLPILMVTSEANDSHLRNVSQSGVNALADKPFQPETVKQLLLQILTAHR